MTKKKPSTNFDLTLICVNYNASFWLRKMLDSLQAQVINQSKFRVKVLVVDNGSSDDSLTMLARDYPETEVIALPENLGFAAANNVALKLTKSKFVMLVNSDVEFTSSSNIYQLLKFLNKQKQVAAITPKLIFSNNQLDPACHRGEPSLWASFTYFTKLERLFPNSTVFGQYHQGWKDLNTIHTIDACSGAAMIIKQSAIKQVGLLDERFFMYAEDLDWCKRMRDKGWLIVYHPGATVIHHKYKSGIKTTSQKIAKQTRRHFYDTMLQYFDKHHATRYPNWVRWLIKVFIVSKKGAL